MSVKRKLRGYLLNALLSERKRRFVASLREKQRRLRGQRHVVSAFLQLDDPYSYLLAYYLPYLALHYDIELRLHLSEARGDEYQAAPGMLAEYSVVDCGRVARELGVPFLDKGATPPVEHRLAMLDAIAVRRNEGGFDEELLEALCMYWRGDAEAVSRRVGNVKSKGLAGVLIDDSKKRQKDLGHYNSAMLHYAGDWYWGVDRLNHLANRLDALGTAKTDKASPEITSIRQAMQYVLPVTPPAAARALPPIELFFSFRSPYSYLALGRTFAIADAFGLDVKLRPVLPMVMRGMQVPRQKLVYILKDAAREAARLGIAFGKIADPVGRGTERCLAVLQYAEAEKRARDFALNAGDAIWARAIDVATDSGMRKVTGKTGLFWPDVKAAMASDEWRAAVEENRESMMTSGAWGVPTARIGDYFVWGQDRDWLLVRHIEELCDTGDGILV